VKEGREERTKSRQFAIYSFPSPLLLLLFLDSLFSREDNSLQIKPILALHRRLFQLHAGILSVVLGIVDDLLLLPFLGFVPLKGLFRSRVEEAREGEEDEFVDKGEDDDASDHWVGRGRESALGRGWEEGWRFGCSFG